MQPKKILLDLSFFNFVDVSLAANYYVNEAGGSQLQIGNWCYVYVS